MIFSWSINWSVLQSERSILSWLLHFDFHHLSSLPRRIIITTWHVTLSRKSRVFESITIATRRPDLMIVKRVTTIVVIIMIMLTIIIKNHHNNYHPHHHLCHDLDDNDLEAADSAAQACLGLKTARPEVSSRKTGPSLRFSSSVKTRY